MMIADDLDGHGAAASAAGLAKADAATFSPGRLVELDGCVAAPTPIMLALAYLLDMAVAGPAFQMRESFDADNALRLTLSGEMDLAVSDAVRVRLDALEDHVHPVRIDLSQLDFIDSSGVRAIVLGLAACRGHGCLIEVDPRVTRAVRRVIELTGIAERLWPDGARAEGSGIGAPDG